jgi:hypothetical protein
VGLDRSALERVLTRAAELQATASDTPEQLSEAQLVALGQEVGVSAEHIRQALAEEKTRVTVPEEQGAVARYFGPATAIASRVVPGRPADVLAALDHWMQHEECLQMKRRFGDRITWEKRPGFIGSITRGLDVAGRGYTLSSVPEVGASVVAVDASRVLVHLDAQLAERRSRVVGISAVIGTVAVGSGLGLVALSIVAGGAIILGAGIGAAVATAGGLISAGNARAQRRFVARVQLALEQVLDRLESQAGRPPSVLSTLGEVVRRLT